LGDYCGIYLPAKIESFPFNVLNHPMYDGSTMTFYGASLWAGSPAGLFLGLQVILCYSLAARFEEPFTAWIYEEKARLEKEEEKNSKKSK
jgi:methylene-fatty-acyl-phospholipid synthase